MQTLYHFIVSRRPGGAFERTLSLPSRIGANWLRPAARMASRPSRCPDRRTPDRNRCGSSTSETSPRAEEKQTCRATIIPAQPVEESSRPLSPSVSPGPRFAARPATGASGVSTAPRRSFSRVEASMSLTTAGHRQSMGESQRPPHIDPAPEPLEQECPPGGAFFFWIQVVLIRHPA